MRYSILVVDDESHIRKGLIARLAHLGFRPSAVYEAANGADALRQIKKRRPELVITDIRMPAMDGLEFVREARAIAPDTAFIILSGYAEFTYAAQAIQLGVCAYLVKPLSNEDLAQTMNALLGRLSRSAGIRESSGERDDEQHPDDRQAPSPPSEADGTDQIRMAVRYIDENYHKPLSVNELADSHGLSPNYFSTLFHREMGINVVHYIRRVRMAEACKLLRETDNSVAAISARVGYSDSQYFFRLFRREMGTSPLQYRGDHRTEQFSSPSHPPIATS